MAKQANDDFLIDDFDITLDSFGTFDDLFKEETTIIADFVDYYIEKPTKEVYETFNKKYKEYKKYSEITLPTKEERREMVLIGEELGVLIARDFDFTDSEVKNDKKAFVEFARERLVEASKKPYYRQEGMLFYIKALYGQTNIAFNLEGDNKKFNISLGNDYVTRLERYTDDRALKGYVLSLRAYRLLIDWQILELEEENRCKKIETELIYATKWDEKNYLAEYALGLVYLNKSWEKYDVEKAKEQFNKVVKLSNVNVALDKYIDANEKARIVSLAKRKLDELK